MHDPVFIDAGVQVAHLLDDQFGLPHKVQSCCRL